MTQAPQSQPPQIPTSAPSRQELRAIAARQKVIILCILVYFGTVAAAAAVPSEMKPYMALTIIAAALTATVFMAMMVFRLFSSVAAVAMIVLSLVPLMGLLVVLIVNAKATGILRRNGIAVGFLGANLGRI